MTDWTELKRLAEEATPGDWYAGNAYDKRFIADYQVIVKIEEGNYVILEGNQNFLEDARRNVAYVAAANPKTILALISENERLRKDADRYQYLKGQGHFRAMSIDMGGNHSWTGMGRHVGKGITVDEAIDAEIARTLQ